MSVVTPRALPLNRNAEQATSSFIERIPLELLAEIFRRCNDGSDGVMSPDTVTNLCLTCKVWRDTAFSTPELWSTIKVTVADKTCSPSRHGLLHRLDRSNTRPLSVSINFQAASGNHALVSLITAHVNRWSTLYLDVGNKVIIPPPFPDSFQAPFLRTLHIQATVSYGLSKSLGAWLVSLVSVAPNLSKVVIPYHEWVSGSFQQLTHFYLTEFVDEICALTIIEQLPQLVECYLSIFSRFSVSNVVPVPTVVCTAHSLHIIPNGNIDYFFGNLSTPNLDTFSIYYSHLGLLQHSVEPETFLSRTTHQITSFTIRNLFMPGAKLVDCLRHLSPSLINLNILSGSITPGFYSRVENVDELVLDSLTFDPSSSDETLCPYLEKMVFERCLNAADGSFSNMVGSRLPQLFSDMGCGVAQIKFVGVVFRYHTHEEDQARLARMKESGLEVDIKTGWPRSAPPTPDWT